MSQNNQPVAIVTGGGRRLGRHIALALAGYGFDLVIGYNTSVAGARETRGKIEQMGRQCLDVHVDITQEDQVENLTQKTLATFGKINLLVNNAGTYLKRAWDEVDLETWEKVLDLNLTGSFLCSQAVGREMVRRGSGRIINIASIGGIQAWPRHIPYSVSKAGIISMTRSLARALAPQVLVNSIAPGTIIMEGEEDPAVSHIPVERIPLRRYGAARDITQVVLYLSTAATYVTGQVFPVDGGRSIDFTPK
jgi:NAD(P)-dependent dehydrogenase (short-subunit alcohol dehydrogenase family)